MKYKMSTPGKFLMLESEDGKHRCEFRSDPIYKSNVDHTIAYYEPVVRYCTCYSLGSSCIDERTSVEEGNELFKKLLRNGYRLVTKKSFA